MGARSFALTTLLLFVAPQVAAADAPPEPERDQDLGPPRPPPRNRIGPKVISLWLSAAPATTRSYCARPGVSSCAEYDTANPTPMGDIVDFSTHGYPVVGVDAEVFPLAAFFDNALQGLGVVGGFGYGWMLTNVTVASSTGNAHCPDGSNPPCPVVMSDIAWKAMLTYRYYFSFNPLAPYLGAGYAGLRVGAAGRVFAVPAIAQVPLPGANRVYPVIAADAVIPIVKWFGVELSGSIFINPNPGPDVIAGYGNPNDPSGGDSSFGFELECGVEGVIWGPFGYRARLRYTSYVDHFYGMGGKWTSTTRGVAAESYTSFILGPTLSF